MPPADRAECHRTNWTICSSIRRKKGQISQKTVDARSGGSITPPQTSTQETNPRRPPFRSSTRVGPPVGVGARFIEGVGPGLPARKNPVQWVASHDVALHTVGAGDRVGSTGDGPCDGIPDTNIGRGPRSDIPQSSSTSTGSGWVVSVVEVPVVVPVAVVPVPVASYPYLSYPLYRCPSRSLYRLWSRRRRCRGIRSNAGFVRFVIAAASATIANSALAQPTRIATPMPRGHDITP